MRNGNGFLPCAVRNLLWRLGERRRSLSGVRYRARAGASGVLAPWIKSAPARELARHNKRFTIEEIIKIVATRYQI